MKKGPLFEKQVVVYLQRAFDSASIERRVMGGANDRGDVAGLYWQGRPFVLEVKNRNRVELAAWMGELADECGNADTDMGAVVFHRPKVGEAHMGEQGVFMSLRTLAVLLGADDGDV
jgi:hypothetical protein